ncbi:MAG: lanthionine synthetase LanC family protein [Candidatus Cybelea sp.]
MPITDPLRVPADLILTPVEELPESTRRRFSYDPGDYALTRPRRRSFTRIVNAEAAALLREFVQPCTVAKAVVRYARAHGESPEATLETAFPLIDRLFASGFLLADGEDDSKSDAPRLSRGDMIGKWSVLSPLQILHGVEVHQVRSGSQLGVLKILAFGSRRSGDSQPFFDEAMLRRERFALDALGAPPVPRILDSGDEDGHFFHVIEWIPGVSAERCAQELRRSENRRALLSLCRGIVAAYAHLHRRGFLHGDVHPRNVLVDAGGIVRLIDFGTAVSFDSPNHDEARLQRAGIGFYYEPEYAVATLEGRDAAATIAGEQYAIAALLYRLVTDAYYFDFSIEHDKMFAQIVTEPPQPFSACGVAAWPEMERVLRRALSKAPEERFPTVAAMAEALEGIPRPAEVHPAARSTSPARELLRCAVAEVAIGGTLSPADIPAPTASIFSGAGGIAYALYRLALLREDAASLAGADWWLLQAERNSGSTDAFLDPPKGLTLELAGKVTPFHGAGGLALLRALISNAQGDAARSRHAASRFARLSLTDDGTEKAELTLGRSGALLGAALIGDMLPNDAEERTVLARLGGQMLENIWNELDALAPIAERAMLPNLGMAHGWCGYLYAALRFRRTFAQPLPSGLRRRLAEIAALAEPWGRGARWPWVDRGLDATTTPGWCNGSAGYVALFTLAHKEFKEDPLLDLAVAAAWNVWEAGNGNGSLCCGEAGRAYALLTLGRHMHNDSAWLTRSAILADRAATVIPNQPERPHGLFRGRIGVALLAADLDNIEASAFPLLEDEGWR